MLLFSLFPPAWVVGTVGLSISKIVENMEIGHNVMHGQWDWMRDPKIHSTTWEWDNASPSEMWKHSHNEVHHTYTNVLGKDHDLGYGIMRVDEDQRWKPFYLGQPLWNAINACLFQYGIAAYDLEIGKYLKGRTDKDEFRRQGTKVLGKMRRHVTRDYVLHPLLSGPSAVTTVTANLTANLVRNLWTHSVIMCGHFPDGVQTYEKTSIDGETRGEWYLRQMLGSANITGSRVPALHDWQPVLPDRAPPVPRPAQQPLPGDRTEGAGVVRALRADLHQRLVAAPGRLGVEEGHSGCRCPMTSRAKHQRLSNPRPSKMRSSLGHGGKYKPPNAAEVLEPTNAASGQRVLQSGQAVDEGYARRRRRSRWRKSLDDGRVGYWTVLVEVPRVADTPVPVGHVLHHR